MGSSWVYLFSKFTSEALLFEALGIFILCAGYAAFWVLKKRKLGAIQNEVPAGVIKNYLNELILDAEQIRAQLFGLLNSAGIQLQQGQGQQVTINPAMLAALQNAAAAAPAASGVNDSALADKLAKLEASMAEKDRMIQSVLSEKAKMESELTIAKAAKSAAPAGGDDGATAALQEKIDQLEGKLAEYSVIEDDLANLKRLQQENAQLKAALGRRYR